MGEKSKRERRTKMSKVKHGTRRQSLRWVKARSQPKFDQGESRVVQPKFDTGESRVAAQVSPS